MSTQAASPPRSQHSQRGEPPWEVARLLPSQGYWSETDYFALENIAGARIELNDGMLEFLPRTSYAHQFLVLYLAQVLQEYLKQSNTSGAILPSPFKVRLMPNVIREPDVIVLRPARTRDRTTPVDGADLLIEIVSAGREDRTRDLQTKRAGYAAGGVAEYWIVDPFKQVVSVLTLDNDSYREHGIFKTSQTITSVLFPGLTLDIDELFAGERREP